MMGLSVQTDNRGQVGLLHCNSEQGTHESISTERKRFQTWPRFAQHTSEKADGRGVCFPLHLARRNCRTPFVQFPFMPPSLGRLRSPRRNGKKQTGLLWRPERPQT